MKKFKRLRTLIKFFFIFVSFDIENINVSEVKYSIIISKKKKEIFFIIVNYRDLQRDLIIVIRLLLLFSQDSNIDKKTQMTFHQI